MTERFTRTRSGRLLTNESSVTDPAELQIVTQKVSSSRIVIGFLEPYSTSGLEEDKAEVFANMMVAPDYVKQRAASDPVIRAKVARMKELLADFCPNMNKEFWERVEQRERKKFVQE